jgi:hypothetical protein
VKQKSLAQYCDPGSFFMCRGYSPITRQYNQIITGFARIALLPGYLDNK